MLYTCLCTLGQQGPVAVRKPIEPHTIPFCCFYYISAESRRDVMGSCILKVPKALHKPQPHTPWRGSCFGMRVQWEQLDRWEKTSAKGLNSGWVLQGADRTWDRLLRKPHRSIPTGELRARSEETQPNRTAWSAPVGYMKEKQGADGLVLCSPVITCVCVFSSAFTFHCFRTPVLK